MEDLKATGPDTVRQLDLLDLLVDYRNAIGHGDETLIEALEASGRVKATKKSYMEYRRSLEALAGTIDSLSRLAWLACSEHPHPGEGGSHEG